MDEPRFQHLFDMKVDLEPPQMIGQTPQGNRQVFYIRSGTFEGPRMKGEVLPGGGDWFLLRPDNVGEIDVRGTLKTDDGALIYATYRGIFSASQRRHGRRSTRVSRWTATGTTSTPLPSSRLASPNTSG